MKIQFNLPSGYRFVELSEEDLKKIVWKDWAPKIFSDNDTSMSLQKVLSDDEILQVRGLQNNLSTLFKFNLCIFYGDEFCGWFYGEQQNAHTFYMQNSAILPQHRRKGLYSALLSEVLARVKKHGFQVVSSRHVTTNNSIIIPKLKAGFVITAMELSDRFGTLVHLSFFINENRKRILEFRAGELKPDQKIKDALGIS
jgi:ribosomal protein S18 acetylase RimI-like enzyme